MDPATVQELELVTLLSAAGAGRRVESQPAAGAETPAPQIAEQPEAEAAAAEQAATAGRRAGGKNTVLLDESGKGGVVVPKDASGQVEWVNSKYNTGNLDSKQIAKLAPEAQAAYATRLKSEGAAAARTWIDTVHAKGERTPVTAVLSGAAPKKPAPKPSAKAAEAAQTQTPATAPEAVTETPYEKMNAADQTRLSEAAEAAVRNGNDLKFAALADKLGLPAHQRRQMITDATAYVHSNTAAAAQQAQPKPTTTPVTNVPKQGAEQVGSPADDNTSRFNVPAKETPAPKPQHYETTPNAPAVKPELTVDEKMQDLVNAAAAKIYREKGQNGIPGKDQLTNMLNDMASTAGVELSITAMRNARSEVNRRVFALEKFDPAAQAAAEALSLDFTDKAFDELADVAARRGSELGLTVDEVADIINARATELRNANAASAATTPPAAEEQPQPQAQEQAAKPAEAAQTQTPTAETNGEFKEAAKAQLAFNTAVQAYGMGKDARPNDEQIVRHLEAAANQAGITLTDQELSQVCAEVNKNVQNLDAYDQTVRSMATEALSAAGTDADGNLIGKAAQLEQEARRIAAELHLPEELVDTTIREEIERQAINLNHEQLRAFRQQQQAAEGKSEFASTAVMNALADRAQIAYGAKNMGEATKFRNELHNAVMAAGGTEEDFQKVWARSAERFDERAAHVLKLADEVMEARVAGDAATAEEKVEEFYRTGKFYGFYINEKGKEDDLMRSMWATAEQRRTLEGKPLHAQQTPENSQREFKPNAAQQQEIAKLAKAVILAEGKAKRTGRDEDWAVVENLRAQAKQRVGEAGGNDQNLGDALYEAAGNMHREVLNFANDLIAQDASGAARETVNMSYTNFRKLAESYGYSPDDINAVLREVRQHRIDNGLPVDRPEHRKGPENQNRSINTMTREERDRLFALVDEVISADVTYGPTSKEYLAKEDALIAAYKELGFDANEANQILWPIVRKARAERGAPVDPPETIRNADGRMTPMRLEELQHLLQDKRGAGFKILSFADKRKILDEINDAEVALALAQEGGEVLSREDIDDIRSLRKDAMGLLTRANRRQLEDIAKLERDARRPGETRRQWRARLKEEREAEETAPTIKEPEATKKEKDPVDLWLEYKEAEKQANNATWLTPRQKFAAVRKMNQAWNAYANAPNPEGHRPIEPEESTFNQDTWNVTLATVSNILRNPDVTDDVKQNIYNLADFIRKQKLGPKEFILLGQPIPDRRGRDRNAPELMGLGTSLVEYINVAYGQINAAEAARYRPRA
ncbi:MAG TPA: hypothetical protein VLG11_06165 [Candidatus Saccharimonadales bacterium]|nr:hypothetical protein [Candidatus Saccharimonadales bacterium]